MHRVQNIKSADAYVQKSPLVRILQQLHPTDTFPQHSCVLRVSFKYRPTYYT
jgi:hypothetical protein